MTRAYRVVMQLSDGTRRVYTVAADSESDAVLAAKQEARRKHPRDRDAVRTMAIATKDTEKCRAWNVWLGSCVLPKGHSGSHYDDLGAPFRATPRK